MRRVTEKLSRGPNEFHPGHAASRPLVWMITHVIHIRPSGFMFFGAKASLDSANNKGKLDDDHAPGLDSHPIEPPAPTASLDSHFPALDQSERFWRRQNWRKEG